MHGSIFIVKVLFFVLILCSEALASHYTDLWAVHIIGGEEVAQGVARRHGFIYRGKIMPDYYHFQHRKVAKRSTFASTYYHKPLADDQEVLWLEQQVAKIRRKRYAQHFNDPRWTFMWYLNRGPGLDMNVQKAWEMGYTGKGVVVTILDDGIEKDHPDLARNYDPHASYDVNSHDTDPQPRYDQYNENRHGTRCAGEVAAESNNSFCSVGVAYNAKIGGVRMLDGDVTDSVEAQSLGLNPDHIHIYSASWGPDDDGRTVDGPATLARKAFYDGITLGRGKLGSIYVWASGNGGRDFDNCNCDGYTNSIYTLSIGSATQNGHKPWYSEDCSATLATTYSSGSEHEKQIVTTDIRRGCTVNHTGTSASAPLAAGLIALALQANPSLTWRDMQHIVVETAKPQNLGESKGWTVNGAGKNVSHSFGFGLMDAAAMVTLAKDWITVPEQHICEIRSAKSGSTDSQVPVTLYTDACEGTVNYVKYLEHVQARITMTSQKRGDIRITLTSPMGTKSILMDKRPRDNSREGFNNWAFMTTHNWGEYAKGAWKLTIESQSGGVNKITLRDWVLVLYGTDMQVPVPKRLPRNNENRMNQTKSPSFSNRHDYGRHHFNQGNRYNHGFHRQDTFYNYDAELKNWTLVMMGTHTQSRGTQRDGTGGNGRPMDDHRPSSNIHHNGRDSGGGRGGAHGSNGGSSSSSLLCAGVTANGICIGFKGVYPIEQSECKPGYFKLGEDCVPRCPQHYFDHVQNIHLASITKPNSTKPLLHTQGICKPCHKSCLTCKEGGEYDCYQCASGYERKDDKCEKQMIWDLLDPDVMKHLAWAIILCIAAILLFSVIFVILQAKDRRRLCWRSKPNYVPDWNKGHYNGIIPHRSKQSDTDGDTHTTNTSITGSCTSELEDEPPPVPFSFKLFHQYSPRVENI